MRPSSASTTERISASLLHWRCRQRFSTSTDSRQTSIISALGCKRPSRSSPIRSSTRCAMAESRPQADLRRGTFHGVDRAEKFVNVFGVRPRFEGQQAFHHGLQMFFGLGDEKFEHFVGHFAVCGQVLDERVRRRGIVGRGCLRRLRVIVLRLLLCGRKARPVREETRRRSAV